MFPAFITMLCIFLIPCWLQISDGSTFQFTAFLSAGSLLFVGCIPYFNDGKLEGLVHNISAYCCAAFAILWIILVTKFWWIILIVLSIIITTAILTKTWKICYVCYVYWLEMVAFYSTFMTMVAHYITTK